MEENVSLAARPGTPADQNQSAVNMSERKLIDGQNSGLLVDDESGSYLPNI